MCDHTVLNAAYVCIQCGQRIFEIEENLCRQCAHFRTLGTGWFCNRHKMTVTPSLLVVYKVTEGSCWEKLKGE